MRALIPGLPVNDLKDLTDIKSVGCVGPRPGRGKPRRNAPGLPFVSCGMQGAGDGNEVPGAPDRDYAVLKHRNVRPTNRIRILLRFS
jgi:hypothetical protein